MNLSRRSATVALGAAVAGLGGRAFGQSREPLRIGAVLALSGPASVFGGPAEKGLRTMLDSFDRAALGGRSPVLTVYDSEGNSTKAVQLFRRLAENDKVHVVLGPSTSGESLALVPVANQMEVPTIMYGGAEAITQPVTPYVFCISPSDRLVIENLMTDFKARKLSRIGLIYSLDAYGQSGGTIGKELAAAYGVSVVSEESFSPQDTTMAPQLLRMRAAQPQAVLIWSGNPGPSIVMRNAKEMGWNVQLYASYASGSRSFIQLTGPAAEDALVPAYRTVAPEALPDSDPMKKPLLEFSKRYRERWNADPDQTSGHGYDSVLWLEHALKALDGPLTRESLRAALETVKLDGANGPRQLSAKNHRGMDRTSVVMMQVKSGRWVLPGQ